MDKAKQLGSWVKKYLPMLFALSVLVFTLVHSIHGARSGAQAGRELTGSTVALASVGISFDVRIGDGLTPGTLWELWDPDAQRSVAQGTVPGKPGAEPVYSFAVGPVSFEDLGTQRVELHIKSFRLQHQFRVLPGWLSLLPPLLAIVMAILYRRVLLSLLCGVWLGALLTTGFNPLTALFRTVDTYMVNAVADRNNALVLIFCTFLGGTVGLIMISGGGDGMAKWVTKGASTSRRGLLSAWALGLLIFFEDYSNALVVGSTMRTVADKLRISREKLAFVVDATSAPVVSLALVSSWIGVELGYISNQFNLHQLNYDAYMVFFHSLAYRFYPILMIAFVGMVIIMKRDYGPMLDSELKARAYGSLARKNLPTDTAEFVKLESKTNRPFITNAAVPLVVIALTAVLGMYFSGRSAARALGLAPSVQNAFANADSEAVLVWAAVLGSIAGLVVSVARKSLTLTEGLAAWSQGVRSVLQAMMILVLAWSLGVVCKQMHTAEWLIQVLGPAISPSLLPAVVFIVGAAVSFSTGTSYGTMGILFPVVIPLAHGLAPGDYQIMVSTISSVLAGAVWGDHCSPISDTTILSSMATGCGIADHVRTQVPYALTVGLVSIVVGDIGAGMGFYPPWMANLLGVGVLFLVLRFVGTRVGNYRADPARSTPNPVPKGKTTTVTQAEPKTAA